MRYSEISNKLTEDLEADDIGRFDPSEDSVEHMDLGDTRRPKLTLKMINRLKKIRATKELEMAQKETFLGSMYGNAPEDDSDV